MNGMQSDISISIFQEAQEAAKAGFDYAANEDVRPIKVTQVVVVRNGTVSGKATVDFVLENEKGEKFVFMLTGALLKAIPC